ncbi:hypothetical protein DJ021_10020 [Phenylobacterium hankyongense]|uniref:Uncharacterized protein n=1 Tax=Phenylobacterium hankyongense TaxID=1813876 RepID=A0A328AZS4_9CAUL|nr:hypothetical protein [Phenylobacterium hankyongense]RAK60117.1 hypothetical protein DJ021_10020 [Phenylobacterium hankyongense]
MLLVADALLTLNHTVWLLAFGRVPNLFDLNGEANIPAWWSSAQLMVAGVIVALVVLRNFRTDRRSWAVAALSAMLILFSMDETASFHERLGQFIDGHLGGKAGTHLWDSGYWPFFIGIPGAIAAGYIVWSSLAFLSSVKGSIGRFAVGLAVLLGAAVGIELLNNSDVPALRTASEILEEALEMVGGSLLVWSACDLILRHPSTAEAAAALLPLPGRREMADPYDRIPAPIAPTPVAAAPASAAARPSKASRSAAPAPQAEEELPITLPPGSPRPRRPGAARSSLP